MKINNTIKALTILLIVPAFYSGLHAQSFKTNESIRDQLKNGTAPGLKFAPNTPAKKQVDDNTGAGKESLVSQIRKGIAPNMQFKTSQGGGAVINKAAAATQPKFTSDLPAKKVALLKAVPLQIPSQEGAGTKNN